MTYRQGPDNEAAALRRENAELRARLDNLADEFERHLRASRVLLDWHTERVLRLWVALRIVLGVKE